MDPLHISHGCHKPRPLPALEPKDQALERTLRVNVLTLEVRAGLALINNALRELRAVGIHAAGIELQPKDGGGARIALGKISCQQAGQILLVADGSTRHADIQTYSATVYGVRLAWEISK